MGATDVMPEATPGQAGRSEVLRRADSGGWEGIPARPYRRVTGSEVAAAAVDVGAVDAAAVDFPSTVTRWLLAGGPGSSCGFELRYFELAAGARTSYERHLHAHAVIVLRGEGEVTLGTAVHLLHAGDLVRVAPGDPHQFRNPGQEPFGFLCVVDAERDRPTPLAESADPSCSLDPG